MAIIPLNYIIRTLVEKDIIYFTPNLLGSVFKISKNKVYDILARLKEKELIMEIEKGKYFVLGFNKAKILANPWYVACKIFIPSYVSFWTALNHYGFTEQVPRMVFLATTRRKRKEIKFPSGTFKYVKLSPYKFFGYQQIFITDLPVLMAEPEKTIIDSFDQPRYAGGIIEIAKCLETAILDKAISNKRLIDYAIRMKNKSLCSRLGFLMERMGKKVDRLRKYIPKSYVLLDPDKSKSKKYNKKWLININLTEKELAEWKEIW